MTSDVLKTMTNEEFRKLFRSMMEERAVRIEELKTRLENTLDALNDLGIEVTNTYGDSFESDDIIFETDF